MKRRQMRGRVHMLAIAVALTAAFGFAMPARAQDDGARVYQFAPVDFQIFTAFLVDKRGNEGPDPGQTTPGSETQSDVFVVRYARRSISRCSRYRPATARSSRRGPRHPSVRGSASTRLAARPASPIP